MAKWICWNDIFEENMKNPVYREEFERGYAEFSKQNAADLAAERMQAERAPALFPPRKIRPLAKNPLRRPSSRVPA